LSPDTGELTASFDGRAVTYGFGELDTLVPAYAATIHKSQGSEYPAVVIPVLTQHYAMLQRNLLYTGVTRGKRLVVLVGQKKAVAIAVRNVSGRALQRTPTILELFHLVGHGGSVCRGGSPLPVLQNQNRGEKYSRSNGFTLKSSGLRRRAGQYCRVAISVHIRVQQSYRCQIEIA
jgi:hypothetical protein